MVKQLKMAIVHSYVKLQGIKCDLWKMMPFSKELGELLSAVDPHAVVLKWCPILRNHAALGGSLRFNGILEQVHATIF